MADPQDPKPRGNLLWILVIAALALLLLFWFLSPSGDTDEAQVEDPIVTPELGTAEGAGIVGEGLPGAGATDPAAAGPAGGSPAPARTTRWTGLPMRQTMLQTA